MTFGSYLCQGVFIGTRSLLLEPHPTAIDYLRPPSVTSNRRRLPLTAFGYLQPPSVTSNRPLVTLHPKAY